MRVYRFGEFALDMSSGELRRAGYRVRLRPQPSRVLEYLLQHSGEVVTRDELRRVLWPDGIFVHFDHGLNSCIKQVRAALTDHRSAPRYLETLSRRGYRFIGAVDVDDGNGRVSSDGFRLSCTVGVVGRRFHATVQLTDPSDETHVWSADFDHELNEVPGTPLGLAAEILEVVRRNVRGAPSEVIKSPDASGGPVNQMTPRQMQRRHRGHTVHHTEKRAGPTFRSQPTRQAR